MKTQVTMVTMDTHKLNFPASFPSTARLATASFAVEDCVAGFLYARFTRLSADRASGSDRTLVGGVTNTIFSAKQSAGK